MDKTKLAITVFDKCANEYQDKFMDVDLYNDSYEKFYKLIEKENAAIFEIACGPGNITKYLLRKRPDFKIFGIDLSPNMIHLAKINNPKAKFQVMDCRDIGKLEQKYDAIMCGFCLPYLSMEEVEKLISDSYNLLNPEGVFYLSTMEDDYNNSGFKGSSSDPDQKIYMHYYQADYLTDVLNKNGFEIINLQRQDYPEHDGTSTTDLIIIAKK